MDEIVSKILENHQEDGNRSGEGAAVELKDGTLFLAYGKFVGGRDDSPAILVCRRSADGGMTWSEPERFFEPEPSWVNAMSLSLLRLQDGRIAALFLVKPDHEFCLPYWMVSSDEAKTWSKARPIVSPDFPGYYVVNNDRLIQLKNGRLLIPYAFSNRFSGCSMPKCGCLISDDAGETWRHGLQEQTILPENYSIPESVIPDRTPALRLFADQRVCTQEPGVVELKNGKVLMWTRSNSGCAYSALSTDQGETWTPFQALCDIPMPNGPQTIMRVPGTNRLFMLHNDRTGIPFGDPTFQWRTPLSIAVSDDEAKTWHPYRPLIADDSVNYCYYSVCFFKNRCLVTTYQGTTQVLEDGKQQRRNLRSMLTVTVPVSWFMRPIA